MRVDGSDKQLTVTSKEKVGAVCDCERNGSQDCSIDCALRGTCNNRVDGKLTTLPPIYLSVCGDILRVWLFRLLQNQRLYNSRCVAVRLHFVYCWSSHPEIKADNAAQPTDPEKHVS